jgi:RNA polymerase sigma-70 factor (ECF subfamily)
MRAWLLRILRNQHVDGVRRSAREVLTGYDIDVPAPAHEPPDLWRYIAIEDLESASKQLPAAARQIYSLFAVQRMSYQSISRQLGIPMATVGTRLRRARVSLRRLVLERMTTGTQGHSDAELTPPSLRAA